jgi:hypothetical protein
MSTHCWVVQLVARQPACKQDFRADAMMSRNSIRISLLRAAAMTALTAHFRDGLNRVEYRRITSVYPELIVAVPTEPSRLLQLRTHYNISFYPIVSFPLLKLSL